MQAAASPVLEGILDTPRKHRSSKNKTIQILGVPNDAVSVFVHFLYSSTSVFSIFIISTFDEYLVNYELKYSASHMLA